MKRVGTTVFGFAIAYILFSFLVDSIIPRGPTQMRVYNVIDVVFFTALAAVLLVQRRSIIEQGVITYERSPQWFRSYYDFWYRTLGFKDPRSFISVTASLSLYLVLLMAVASLGFLLWGLLR